MTTIFVKNERVQPLFLSGLEPGESVPDIYTNLEVEVLDTIEVSICWED